MGKQLIDPDHILRHFRTDLPDDLIERLNDRPLMQYCFYQRISSNHKLYWFSCCDLELDLTRGMENDIYSSYDLLRFKHNEVVECPHCGTEVLLKCMGRMRGSCYGEYPSLFERRNLVMFDSFEDGLMIRVGACYFNWRSGRTGFDGYLQQSIGDPWPERRIEFNERRRYYIRKGKIMGWTKSFEYLTETSYRAVWQKSRSVRSGHPFARWSYMNKDPEDGRYSTIGTEHLAETDLKYSGIEHYFKDFQEGLWEYDTIAYLMEYVKHPQLEMLSKLGFREVVTGAILGNYHNDLLDWKATNPADFFRMSKPDFKVFRNANGNLWDILRARSLKEHEVSFQDFLQEKKRFCSYQPFGDNEFDLCLRMTERCGVTLHRAITYALKCKSVRMWDDYLNMAQKAGYDLSNPEVSMPKNLRDRHDDVLRLTEIKTNKKLMKAYAKEILPRLKKLYEFQMDGMSILVPESDTDIIVEGKILRHCVGGYADRHLKGIVAILFLRASDAPDKSLVTIEMNGTHLVQIHGYRNEMDGAPDPRKVYAHIIDPWLDWVGRGSPRMANGTPVMKKEEKTA